mmetsp:Transcript_43576/g.63880  ORF Transcript_43576/g.63880 Transcript_43576/m.63880 type:complete len:93 (+) Transcript_43576:3-281(+)
MNEELGGKPYSSAAQHLQFDDTTMERKVNHSGRVPLSDLNSTGNKNNHNGIESITPKILKRYSEEGGTHGNHHGLRQSIQFSIPASVEKNGL